MMDHRVEKIVRPIVQGQIRSFLNDHPEITGGCTRHVAVGKAAPDWIVDSLAKRIVRDLACGNTVARLEAALLEFQLDSPLDADVARLTASAVAGVELRTAPAIFECRA